MSSEPAYITALKALTRADPSRVSIRDMMRDLYVTGNDRTIGVVLGSWLENGLQDLLASKMRKEMNSESRKAIFGVTGLAGTFSAKTSLAYALGIVGDQTKSDLTLIRVLRNEFAHSREVFGFEDRQVGDVCAQFMAPDWDHAEYPSTYLLWLTEDEREQAKSLAYAKTRFVCCVHTLTKAMHACCSKDAATCEQLLP